MKFSLWFQLTSLRSHCSKVMVTLLNENVLIIFSHTTPPSLPPSRLHFLLLPFSLWCVSVIEIHCRALTHCWDQRETERAREGRRNTKKGEGERNAMIKCSMGDRLSMLLPPILQCSALWGCSSLVICSP